MENKIENPPAFPLSDPNSVYNEGMTLRDYFAGQAMQGNLASCNPGFIHKDLVQELARTYYLMADAMLKERNKNG